MINRLRKQNKALLNHSFHCKENTIKMCSVYLIAICTLAVPTPSVSSLSNTTTSDTDGLKEKKDN